MGEFFKNINWKHVLIMCIGNILAGMGIAIFKLAGLGTDPFSGMNMAVAAKLGMAYGNFIAGCADCVRTEVSGNRYGCECGVPGLYLYVFLLYFYGRYGAGTGGYAGKTCGIVRWRCDYLSGIVDVSDAG